MREIDDRYLEFAPAYEPVKGGKHHKKIGGALARAMLAAAATGLFTLSILNAVQPRSEAVFAPQDPQPPVVQPVDPQPPAPPPVEKEKDPVTPPPTTPPPTTPPPTTPPPTTPPPTTPPPTTPPPTTPPPTITPFYPYYEPVTPVPFTAPTLKVFPDDDGAGGGIINIDGIDQLYVGIGCYFELTVGSATRVDVTPTLYVPDIGSGSADTWAFTSDGMGEASPEILTDPTISARPTEGTLIVTASYKQNGEPKTISVSVPVRITWS